MDIDLSNSIASAQQMQDLLGYELHERDHGLERAIYALARGELRRHMSGFYLLRGIPTITTPLAAESERATRTWLFMAGTNIADMCVEETRLDIAQENLILQDRIENRLAGQRDYGRYLNALAAGIPPTVGIGMSLSRLMQVLSGSEDIRDTEWWSF